MLVGSGPDLLDNCLSKICHLYATALMCEGEEGQPFYSISTW